MSPVGRREVIYSFKGGSDGQYPYARLLDLSGTLYGTTYSGGVSLRLGIIFKVSTLGQRGVL